MFYFNTAYLSEPDRKMGMSQQQYHN